MFIVTARVPKKKLLAGGITALCCCLAAAVILTLGGRTVTASAEVKHIRSNDDRLAYLNSLGWQVSDQPMATEELLIPEVFDESYSDYLALQLDQGFDLTQYCGKRIKRYTYQILNYPSGDEPVQVALLIYKNRVIGGQVQSSSGSFLHGLAMPAASTFGKPDASQSPASSAEPSPSAAMDSSSAPSAAPSGLRI